MRKTLFFILLVVSIHGFSQRGIGTNTPAKSSILELSSTSKGFLVPRMTMLNRDAIQNPVAGLLIFCTDCSPKGFTIFSDNKWRDPFGTTPTITAEQSTEIETNTTNNKGTIKIHEDINHAGSGKIITDSERDFVKVIPALKVKINDLIYVDPGDDKNIGTYYQGGIISCVLAEPIDLNNDGWLDRGFIISLDQLEGTQVGIEWSKGVLIETGASGLGIGTGKQNTDAIISTHGLQTDYAAGLASAYTKDGYDDWFLPSLEELQEIYKNMDKINLGLEQYSGTELKVNNRYWSSSENTKSQAWSLNFKTTGAVEQASNKNSSYRARAIRIF
jgi:hypothetical protein